MEKKIKKNNIPKIRTFKTDVSEYIKRKNLSILDIASIQTKKNKYDALKSTRFQKTRNFKKILLIIIIILFLSSGVLIGGFFIFNKKNHSKIQTSFFPKPIIAADKTIEVKLNNVKNIFQTFIPVNNFFYFPITEEINGNKKNVNIKDFFNYFNVNLSPELLDSLKNNFMLAILHTSQKWPILIFRVKSYERSFSAMLKWEKKMGDDLKNIFKIENIEKSKVLFIDKEIKNHDTRALFDQNGKIILIYSFVNQKYLIITTNKDAIIKVFKRISSAQYLND